MRPLHRQLKQLAKSLAVEPSEQNLSIIFAMTTPLNWKDIVQVIDSKVGDNLTHRKYKMKDDVASIPQSFENGILSEDEAHKAEQHIKSIMDCPNTLIVEFVGS